MTTRPRTPRSPRHAAGRYLPAIPGRLRHVSVLVALLGLAPVVASDVRGQTGDYNAYPQNLTAWDTFGGGASRLEKTFSRMPGLSPEYRLGSGDQLEVTIVGQNVRKVTIGSDGTINIPLAGYVTVRDLTAEEAELAIAGALRDKDLIKDPQVLLFISDYQAKRVYTLGEIDRPGEYAMSFQMTLMDLIFLSGGIDFTAGRYTYLHRRGPDGSSQWKPTYTSVDIAELTRQPDTPRAGAEVVRIDLQPMKEGGVLEKNIVLRAGDVFYVPRQRFELVYVIGDVPNAGAFNMPQGDKLSASQAIAWAGGPRKTAKMKQGLVVRLEPDGQRREIPADFAAILEGKQSDVDLLPNDIIFIPGSGARTIGIGLLNTVPAVVSKLLFFF